MTDPGHFRAAALQVLGRASVLLRSRNSKWRFKNRYLARGKDAPASGPGADNSECRATFNVHLCQLGRRPFALSKHLYQAIALTELTLQALKTFLLCSPDLRKDLGNLDQSHAARQAVPPRAKAGRKRSLVDVRFWPEAAIVEGS